MRHYNTQDHLGGAVRAGLGTEALAVVHPFSWEGWQFTSGVSVRF